MRAPASAEKEQKTEALQNEPHLQAYSESGFARVRIVFSFTHLPQKSALSVFCCAVDMRPKAPVRQKKDFCFFWSQKK
ncbi:hypothetical protein BCY91_12105 [Pelobium manganitolerans]|uniref:Uncharacterized protein n=1 Tax=Pelobium manganitolerans TaxID=1842495 RepID=A0A419S1M1_9SPHI|nr:hypothetical protein BCY91_12105 [Pelobium manganitolerans]